MASYYTPNDRRSIRRALIVNEFAYSDNNMAAGTINYAFLVRCRQWAAHADTDLH